MTATRVYTEKQVFKKFREAGIHGSYKGVLKREGISATRLHDVGGETVAVRYYPADAVDAFLKMVRL